MPIKARSTPTVRQWLDLKLTCHALNFYVCDAYRLSTLQANIFCTFSVKIAKFVCVPLSCLVFFLRTCVRLGDIWKHYLLSSPTSPIEWKNGTAALLLFTQPANFLPFQVPIIGTPGFSDTLIPNMTSVFSFEAWWGTFYSDVVNISQDIFCRKKVNWNANILKRTNLIHRRPVNIKHLRYRP